MLFRSGAEVGKLTGATTATEKLLRTNPWRKAKEEKNTYPGRDRLKRWPVVSSGGEAAALRQDWRGGTARVVSGACPVVGGAFGAPACADSEARAQRESERRKKKREAGQPVFITGAHPRRLPGFIVPDFLHGVVKNAAVTATRSIVRPLLLSMRSNRTVPRSEERRVGKECTSWCRSRWSPYH